MAKYKFETMLNSVSQTQTGGCAGVAGYRRLGFQFKLANVVTGNGIFKVQGTVNGTDWTFLNLIDNLATSNSQTLTHVVSKTLSANSSVLLWADEGLALRAVRVWVQITTDGSYSTYLMASE